MTTIKTWYHIQELTEDVCTDPAAVEALKLETAADALLTIHREGYDEIAEPETRVEPVLMPYIDPVTRETIVAVIVVNVKCTFRLEPRVPVTAQ